MEHNTNHKDEPLDGDSVDAKVMEVAEIAAKISNVEANQKDIMVSISSTGDGASSSNKTNDLEANSSE